MLSWVTEGWFAVAGPLDEELSKRRQLFHKPTTTATATVATAREWAVRLLLLLLCWWDTVTYLRLIPQSSHKLKKVQLQLLEM